MTLADAAAPEKLLQVGVLLYAGVSELEVGLMLGLLQHLGEAARVGTPGAVAVTLARSRGSVVCAGGLVSTPQLIFAAAPPLAGVLIPGGLGAQKAGRDPAAREFLQQRAALGVPLGVCGSGLLLAGEAGLLQSRLLGCPPELSDTVWGYSPADLNSGETVADETGPALDTGPGGLNALQITLRLAARLWPAAAVAQAAQNVGAVWQSEAASA